MTMTAALRWNVDNIYPVHSHEPRKKERCMVVMMCREQRLSQLRLCHQSLSYQCLYHCEYGERDFICFLVDLLMIDR